MNIQPIKKIIHNFFRKDIFSRRKLTVSINQDLINGAKDNGLSFSKLIENDLLSINKKTKENSKTSILVERLTGVISLERDDYKEDYIDYLSEKYS